MTIVVNIKKRVKLVQNNNENTKLTNLPWTDHKTKPNELKHDRYETKMTTLMRMNGCQVASQG